MYMSLAIEVNIDCSMLYTLHGLLVAPNHTEQKETQEDKTISCEI
jgi:hypothetical protein